MSLGAKLQVRGVRAKRDESMLDIALSVASLQPSAQLSFTPYNEELGHYYPYSDMITKDFSIHDDRITWDLKDSHKIAMNHKNMSLES